MLAFFMIRRRSTPRHSFHSRSTTHHSTTRLRVHAGIAANPFLSCAYFITCGHPGGRGLPPFSAISVHSALKFPCTPAAHTPLARPFDPVPATARLLSHRAKSEQSESKQPPLFPCTYKRLLSELFCFDCLTNAPGVCVSLAVAHTSLNTHKSRQLLPPQLLPHTFRDTPGGALFHRTRFTDHVLPAHISLPPRLTSN